MSDRPEIDFLRSLLKEWDNGDVPEWWIISRIRERYLIPMVEIAAQGQQCGVFSTVCNGSNNPPKPKRAIVEVGALGKPIWFYPWQPCSACDQSGSDCKCRTNGGW